MSPSRTSARTFGRAAPVIVCAALVACSRGDDRAPIATPSVVFASPTVSAGRVVDVTYRFAVAPEAPPLEEDYTVFVHAIDDTGKRLWTGDHEPATPTRAWTRGQVIEYTHPMVVPRRTKEGPVAIDIGLYSPRTRDRLPLVGTSSGMRSYRVAALTVVPGPGDPPAIFVEGWHDTETPADDPGVEWHWSSTAEGHLWLRNPKRDAVLVLELDQPVALPQPQQVQIRVGAVLAESFPLTPGERQIRRVKLSASQLGDTDIARFTIAVDRTFVPASVPQAASSDARELGVRVFDAVLRRVP